MKAGGLIFLFLMIMAIVFGLILGNAEIMKPYSGPQIALEKNFEIQQAVADQQQARAQRRALGEEELRHIREQHLLEEMQMREALRHAEAMNRQREAAQRQYDEAMRRVISEIVPLIAMTFIIVLALAIGAFAFVRLYRSVAHIQAEQAERRRAAQTALLRDQQLARAQSLADSLLAIHNQTRQMPPLGNAGTVEGGAVRAQPRGQPRPRSRLIAPGRSA